MTTGYNMRAIMMLAGKNNIHELDSRTTDFEYNKLGRDEEWKANLVQELIELRHGGLKVPGMKLEELEEILVFICTG